MLEKCNCPYFCLTIRHCLVFITHPASKTSVVLMFGYLGLMFWYIVPLSLYSNTYLSILLIAREPPASHQPLLEDNLEPPNTSVACSVLCFWAQMWTYFVTIWIKFGPTILLRWEVHCFYPGFLFLISFLIQNSLSK